MNNIVKLQQSLPALPISADNIPDSIEDGVKELYFAFADPGQKDDVGKAFTIKSYLRAIMGQHPSLVLWCLEHLILHNPRNPFRPSAQDVHEFIQKTDRRWNNAILGYFLEKSYQEDVRWSGTLDGPPSYDGACPLPTDMVVAALSRELSHSPPLRDLESLSDVRFARIPKPAFPGTLYQEVLARRAARKKRMKPLTELNEYLAGMDEDQREFRRLILLERRANVRRWGVADDLTEPTLMESVARAHNAWRQHCDARGVDKPLLRARTDKRKFIGEYTNLCGLEVFQHDLRCIPLADLEKDYQ